MTEPTLFDVPAPEVPPPRRRRRWVPRCEDCKRRIWAASSMRRRFGRLLGGGCYRKRVRAARRLRIPQRIVVRPAGDIAGQMSITDMENQ